jgi:hypothetical protein
MLELEIHILRLLLDNDCVIIPNFGGFVAHHVDAYYDEEEKVYFPPTRSIGFNPQLTMNDSLLAQSYVDAYDISYPEALKRIGEKVASIKQIVETEGEYYINGIGFITKSSDSKLDFQPCRIPVLTPSYYGLSPIHVDALEQEAKVVVPLIPNKVQEEEIATEEPADEVSSDESVSIHIPVSIIHKFVAVVIVFIMFAMFPSPIGDSSKSAQVKSAVDTNVLYRMMPKEMTKGKPEKLAEHVVVKEDKATQSQTEVKQTVPSVKTVYSIVLASRVTKANAEAFVSQLHKKGMTEAEVYSHGKTTKVVYKHFPTKEEATQALYKLTDNTEFSGCWVSEIEVAEP